MNQPINHRSSRLTPKIEPERNLHQILLHALTGNAALSSAHAGPERRPETSHGIRLGRDYGQ
jgi:hypothetical protein